MSELESETSPMWREHPTDTPNDPPDCERFLREYGQAYTDLREDPGAWEEVQAERRAFDGTLMDGLEGE